MNFIVGYGSLINAKSRHKTWKSSFTSSMKVLAVRLRGFKREWSVRGHGSNCTVLGCSVDDNSICNGVLFPLQAGYHELEAFDERESGYLRSLVPAPSIEFPYSVAVTLEIESFKAKISTGEYQVWIYLNVTTVYPTIEYPLVQSYIDVVICGCLEYGHEFAREFIETTHWVFSASESRQENDISPMKPSELLSYYEYPWIIDREPPSIRRYVRAEETSDLPIEEIEHLLRRYLPVKCPQDVGVDIELKSS